MPAPEVVAALLMADAPVTLADPCVSVMVPPVIDTAASVLETAVALLAEDAPASPESVSDPVAVGSASTVVPVADSPAIAPAPESAPESVMLPAIAEPGLPAGVSVEIAPTYDEIMPAKETDDFPSIQLEPLEELVL